MSRHIIDSVIPASIRSGNYRELIHPDRPLRHRWTKGAIGVAEPVSFLVDAAGARPARNADLAEALRPEFYPTPSGIIRRLDMLKPIYLETAAYGHFGRKDIAAPRECVLSTQSS